MVGWHHRLDGHEFEQALGDGKGQGRLGCCNPWGHKELDTTWRLNNNDHKANMNKAVIAEFHLCSLQKQEKIGFKNTSLYRKRTRHLQAPNLVCSNVTHVQLAQECRDSGA